LDEYEEIFGQKNPSILFGAFPDLNGAVSMFCGRGGGGGGRARDLKPGKRSTEEDFWSYSFSSLCVFAPESE